MSKKNKILLVLGSVIFVLILYFFLPNIIFSIKSIKTEKDFISNFKKNKPLFSLLSKSLKSENPISFFLEKGDTISISFEPRYTENIENYNDTIHAPFYFCGTKTPYDFDNKTDYSVIGDSCLMIISNDTTYNCSSSWYLYFNGHYKNQKIINMLEYYGWSEKKLESVINILKKIKGTGLSLNKSGDYIVYYKTIHFYDDGGFYCFGNSDAFFEYVYTNSPEDYILDKNYLQLDSNFFGLIFWHF